MRSGILYYNLLTITEDEMKDLDFIEDSGVFFSNSSQIEVPKPVAYREELSSSELRSPTFESVLQQNEDLMERLKIALRRLNQMELMNSQISIENNKIKLQNQSLMSRYAVHKEEVDSYKNDIKKLEIERDKALEIKNLIEQKNLDLVSTSEQFEVFKEKISSEVKPYITELKSENIRLKEELEIINSYKLVCEQQIHELREHIIEVTQSYSQENKFIKENYENKVASLSDQIVFLKTELAEKQNAINELEIRIQKANLKTEHLDVVENSLIQEKHYHESTKLNLNSEINRLQLKLQEVSSLNSDLEIKYSQLDAENKSQQNYISERTQEIQNLSEQMNSLRVLFSKKNLELERLQKSTEALERLNIELSKSLKNNS